ncbi:MAG: DUF1800 domain-containing protein [Pseudonocardia sp.]|nr:DUF1800 domain-containing protein [Pseudonocardia sp.]
MSDKEAVRRLLERLGLGPRPGELQRAIADGFDTTLAGLTSPAPGPDAGALATPPPQFGPPTPPLGRNTTIEQRRAQLRAQAVAATQLGVWWLDRLAAVESPFTERMTWFWHGHFATSVRKVREAQLMYQQNDTFRRLGRGDFRILAQAMLVDPAMLIWLDGGGNRVGKPNENLAREFMELFALGVGNYSETDVRQAARALTGWRVDYRADQASLVARAHDKGPETVLGTTGALDASTLVDVVLSQPASPKFLARRVWTRFVSDSPPDPATLNRLVNAYGPGRDITALLTEVARSPGFRAPASAMVKEPVLWLVTTLRALQLPASKLPAQALQSALLGMGQVPFAPPNVGGWPSGVPWLTTAAALTRLRVAQTLASTGNIATVSAASPSGRIDATAALLGITSFTDRTAGALRPLINQPAQLVALALTSPEHTVSA